MDYKGNLLKLKLYPTLRNTTEVVHLAKGGNILEYRAKVNALVKPRSSHLSTTLALQGIQTSEHKQEKTLPLGIHNEVQKEFIVVCKNCITEYGG
jgi:hypothetical protein